MANARLEMKDGTITPTFNGTPLQPYSYFAGTSQSAAEYISLDEEHRWLLGHLSQEYIGEHFMEIIKAGIPPVAVLEEADFSDLDFNRRIQYALYLAEQELPGKECLRPIPDPGERKEMGEANRTVPKEVFEIIEKNPDEFYGVNLPFSYKELKRVYEIDPEIVKTMPCNEDLPDLYYKLFFEIEPELLEEGYKPDEDSRKWKNMKNFRAILDSGYQERDLLIFMLDENVPDYAKHRIVQTAIENIPDNNVLFPMIDEICEKDIKLFLQILGDNYEPLATRKYRKARGVDWLLENEFRLRSDEFFKTLACIYWRCGANTQSKILTYLKRLRI